METAQKTDEKCQHCGMLHSGVTCPRIAAIDYYPDGAVRRVEYVQPPPIRVDAGDISEFFKPIATNVYGRPV